MNDIVHEKSARLVKRVRVSVFAGRKLNVKSHLWCVRSERMHQLLVFKECLNAVLYPINQYWNSLHRDSYDPAIFEASSKSHMLWHTLRVNASAVMLIEWAEIWLHEITRAVFTWDILYIRTCVSWYTVYCETSERSGYLFSLCTKMQGKNKNSKFTFNF